MSVPIPLQVVLTGTAANAGTLDITPDIRDLQMRWSDPGGYASCQVSLDRPLSLQPSEVAYFNALSVFDARTGQVVWDGRLEDPGRSGGGQNGNVYNLAAIGGQAHTRDEVKPRFYVDNTLDFFRSYTTSKAGDFQIAEDPGEALGADGEVKQALVMQFPQGTVVTDAGPRVQVRYDRPKRAGVNIARVDYSWDAGVTDPLYLLSIFFSRGAIGSGFPRPSAATYALNTAGGDPAAHVIANPISLNQMDSLDFRLARVTTTPHTIPNDNYWVSVKDMNVVATRFDIDGDFISDPAEYANPFILPHEVIGDLVGRHLPQLEADHRSIDHGSTYQIGQLAYMDGCDAETVLTDLMALDAGYTWRVWERGGLLSTTTTGSVSGKFQFEWQPIPTQVRYEADLIDGYESTGSIDTVYNQVSVRWSEATGRSRSTLVTSFVGVLDDAGVVRRGQIDLGDEVGTAESAQRAGEQWLIDRATATNAGRLRIARPILDLVSGRMVMPWEIRPGLIRVKGIQPHPDVLNVSTRDGVTTFRIIGHDFSASDGAATLELDSYPPSLAHVVANLVHPPDPPNRVRPRPPMFR